MASTIRNFDKINQIISDNIDDPIFILNENLKCEYINLEDLTEGKHILDFIYPEDSNRVIKFLKNLFKTGYGIEESRIKFVNKQFCWYEIKGKRFVDDNQRKKVFLICREITKFKDIENEIKKSQIRYVQLADTLPEIKYWKLLQSKEGITAVQKAREMLELVIDNIPQLIFWKDTNLTYLGCNKSYAIINGIEEPSNIIGKKEKDLRWFKKNLIDIQEHEQNVIINDKAEYKRIESLITPNGNQVWFEINRIPLHDFKDNVVGILSTYENITIRKTAEQKLKESEEKYRGILDNIKEGYFEVDLKGNLTFFNDSLCKLLGYSQEELLGLNYQFITDNENKNKIFNGFNKVFRTGKLLTDFQYQVKKRSGEHIICETSVYLKYDSNGNKVGFSGITRDITEKYALEQKIKESEEKYRTIFNASPDYIFLTDIKGNILDMNPALLERIGMTLEEIRGINFIKFYVGSSINELWEKAKDLISGGELRGLEVKAKNKYGEIFEYEVNSVPLKEDGKVTTILNLARDITDKKVAEQKVKASEKKYRHLFESSPYAIWLMDEKGTIVDCNSAMSNILSSLEPNDLIGKNFSEVLSVLKRPEYLINILKDRFEKFQKSEKLGPLELQMTRIDGSKIWLSILSSLVKIGDKTLTQALIQDITEQKNIEQKIKESELKYRHLFESSPYSIILVDRKGKIIDVNPATEKLFGRRVEDLINRNFLEVSIKPEKALPLFKQRYLDILNGEVPEPLEILISRSTDNKELWINIDDSIVELGGENVFQVIIQDITEKKFAEQKLKKSEEELKILNRELEQKVLERTKDLRQSEQQYRTTIDSLNDPLHVIDKDYRIILVNKEFKNWLEELKINIEIYGKNVFEAFPFLPKKVYKEYSDVFDTGKTLITTESTTFSNLDIITETRKIPIFSEGKVNQVITIIRDITEKSKMEEQLKESEENFRNMITNLDEGYYKANLDGTILYHNPAFNRISGFDFNENLIGRKIPFFRENPSEAEKYTKELLKNGFIKNYILSMKKNKEKRVYVQINAHLIREEDNEPVAIEGTFSDITEKFRLQQELMESERKLREQNVELKKLDKIKNDFITMAAHELKTPLISISGYTDYILMKYRSQLGLEITEDLIIIQKNINRLEVLMDQLLDVLKIDENELKLQKEKTNLSKIINNCLDELSYLINDKNLEIILNIEPEIIMCIDPNRIFTVFTNLISNAIKFTADYGWIEISVKKEEDHYIFKIKDNGIGITKDEMGRLFKKFERIKPPIISKNINIKDSGTGLGLYITKGIINAHGGAVWAESEGENKGTTFAFTLPI